jgi:hypothetical protein
MGKHDDNIDFEVLALQSGLFDTLPPPPPRSALEYPGRAVDFEVLDLDGGIFDAMAPPPRTAILPPPPVPRHDSIAPMIAADPSDDALPPVPVQRMRVAPIFGAAAAFAMMALAVVLRPAGGAPAAAASPRVEPTIVVPMEVTAPKPQVAVEAAPAAVAPAPHKATPRARAAAPKAAPAAAPAIEKAPDDLQIAPPAAPPKQDIDMAAASRAVGAAAHAAAACLEADDARTTMPVSLTFAPSGRVTSAKVTGGPFVGSEIGGCIARSLRGASVAPFDGEPVTVSTTVRLR